MTILQDPENNESRALFNLFSDWAGRSVLEIGSGDGRLTWRFAEKAARVVALEPNAAKHAAALANHPRGMGHVAFLNLGLEMFTKQTQEKFDMSLLSWSL
jgi:cyclopropane fatty-acyl-phospholipid synthase-like methyltransferase